MTNVVFKMFSVRIGVELQFHFDKYGKSLYFCFKPLIIKHLRLVCKNEGYLIRIFFSPWDVYWDVCFFFGGLAPREWRFQLNSSSF